MKAAIFATMLGASVLAAAHVQAKWIGVDTSSEAMLPLCKSEIAQGRAGVCAGFVLGIRYGMAGELCIPEGIEFEDMVQVVVNWTDTFIRTSPEKAHYFPANVEAALRHTWRCQK